MLLFNTLALPLISLLPLATAHPCSPLKTNATCTRAQPDLTNCSPQQDSSTAYQCPHHYTFPEFSPGAGSNRQPYFRFQIFFKFNSSLCEEQAHEHWQTVHADLTLATKNTGVWVERYVQFHADRASREAIQSLVDTGAVEVAPYDGIAEFHAKDAASMLKFMENVLADQLLGRDTAYFVHTSVKFQVMAGYDTLIYGSGIETSCGTDGILPGDARFNNGY